MNARIWFPTEGSEPAVTVDDKYLVGYLFSYRRPVTVTEQSGTSLEHYQVLLELNSSNFDFSHVNSDGSDIRFYDGNDFLPYWIEKWDSSNQEAKIWIKVPSIPASGTTTFYMYYGNSDVTESESDVEATFIRVIDGLVGAWHFDEGEGTTAYDSSGNGNHGTIYGATWTTDGKFGKALSFDGTDDYVDCGRDNSLDMTGPFAIEAWVKLNELTGDHQVIAGRWYDGETADQSYGLEFGHNVPRPQVIVYDTSQTTCASPEDINYNQWYHVVGLYDGSYLRIYVNNTQKNSCSYSGNICLLYTSPSPRDLSTSRMPSSA